MASTRKRKVEEDVLAEDKAAEVTKKVKETTDVDENAPASASPQVQNIANPTINTGTDKKAGDAGEPGTLKTGSGDDKTGGSDDDDGPSEKNDSAIPKEDKPAEEVSKEEQQQPPKTKPFDPAATEPPDDQLDDKKIIQDTSELPPSYVGRVIGKGGEMIRDLQARSGCLRIDVDQNVPHNAPRIISYRGTRAKIEFAKKLVQRLCREDGNEAELPLGDASIKRVRVPANTIGKVIGRKGDMIRRLQHDSMAKIQVDHSNNQGHERTIVVTGMKDAVTKAEEMILFLTSNPLCDAAQSLAMLVGHKANSGKPWGSGPPYEGLPNNGIGMTEQCIPSHFGGGGYGNSVGGGGMVMPQQQTTINEFGNVVSAGYSNTSGNGGIECEVVPMPKFQMGRIIGQKGVTINDLQKRSGCDIQIDQKNAQPGQDCPVSIKGSRQGIEMAKKMLQDIIEMGHMHPYAGGHGGHQSSGFGGGGGQGYGQMNQGFNNQFGGGMAQPQQQFGGFQQQQHQQQQQQQAFQGGQQSFGYSQQQQQPGPPQMNPWRAATAADGSIYYYNSITFETTWDCPPGM